MSGADAEGLVARAINDRLRLAGEDADRILAEARIRAAAAPPRPAEGQVPTHRERAPLAAPLDRELAEVELRLRQSRDRLETALELLVAPDPAGAPPTPPESGAASVTGPEGTPPEPQIRHRDVPEGASHRSHQGLSSHRGRPNGAPARRLVAQTLVAAAVVAAVVAAVALLT